MKCVAVFFVVACASLQSTVVAQQADSIYSSLNQNPDNLAKIKELAVAANTLASSSPTEAVKLARRIIHLSATLNSAEGQAIGYNELGNAFERYSVYDSAFHYFFISHHLFAGMNSVEGRADVLINIGNAHEIMGNYDSAAFYAFKALAFV